MYLSIVNLLSHAWARHTRQCWWDKWMPHWPLDSWFHSATVAGCAFTMQREKKIHQCWRSIVIIFSRSGIPEREEKNLISAGLQPFCKRCTQIGYGDDHGPHEENSISHSFIFATQNIQKCDFWMVDSSCCHLNALNVLDGFISIQCVQRNLFMCSGLLMTDFCSCWSLVSLWHSSTYIALPPSRYRQSYISSSPASKWSLYMKSLWSISEDMSISQKKMLKIIFLPNSSL